MAKSGRDRFLLAVNPASLRQAPTPPPPGPGPAGHTAWSCSVRLGHLDRPRVLLSAPPPPAVSLLQLPSPSLWSAVLLLLGQGVASPRKLCMGPGHFGDPPFCWPLARSRAVTRTPSLLVRPCSPEESAVPGTLCSPRVCSENSWTPLPLHGHPHLCTDPLTSARTPSPLHQPPLPREVPRMST